jgi:hypothetical protein
MPGVSNPSKTGWASVPMYVGHYPMNE